MQKISCNLSHPMNLPHPVSLSHSFTRTHTLSLLHALSLLHMHTHTHTHTHKRQVQPDAIYQSKVIVELCERSHTGEHLLVGTVAHIGLEGLVRGTTATHCNTLQHTATLRSTLQHTATHCNTLQHTATHCNTLQHSATHCNISLEDLVRGAAATYCNTPLHVIASLYNLLENSFLLILLRTS